MSKYLLQWLRRTRMTEGMIWKAYFKHRRQELRERFPQCGRRGTSTAYLTVLQFRAIMGNGLNYDYEKCERDWFGRLSSSGDRIGMSEDDIPGDYYVKYIRLVYLDDSIKRFMIYCRCCELKYPDPVIEIPDFNFKMSIRYWWPAEVRDFIDHVHEFFPQWSEEMELIEREVTKLKKLTEMRKIRSERLGIRELEQFVVSRYRGTYEIEGEYLYVVVPLYNGHDITFEMPMRYHIPEWWEKIKAMVSAVVELFQKEIAEGSFDWELLPLEIKCKTGRWIMSWHTKYYKWVRHIYLEELVFKKKSWRKLMPFSIEIT
ncbi:MAG: hypothetical protein J6S87_04330 [Bacteroidales bacterium]|nr:hypothetical protein [Bacteroidales bacterium]